MEFVSILAVLSLTGMLSKIKNAIVLIDEPDQQIAEIVADVAVLIPVLLVDRIPSSLTSLGLYVAHGDYPAINLLEK